MSILYIGSFDSQTHLGMQRGAKMCLAFNEQIEVVLCSNHHTESNFAIGNSASTKSLQYPKQPTLDQHCG